jgi:hypothetical protein
VNFYGGLYTEEPLSNTYHRKGWDATLMSKSLCHY